MTVTLSTLAADLSKRYICLVNLLTNLFIGLSIGANVVAARSYGAKTWDDLRDTVHTSMLLSMISGGLLMVLGVIGARQMLIWMQTPEEVLPLATTYLRIYFLGMASTMVYNFGSALLRAVGDTKRPLYFLLCAGVINVVLNLIFVVGFHPPSLSLYMVLFLLIPENAAP